MALTVGRQAPKFKGTALIGGNADKLNQGNAFREISLGDYTGKWLVLFFYPLDFTPAGHARIIEFSDNYEAFRAVNCEVIACSTDSPYSHLAWRRSDAGLKCLPFAMLSDFTRRISGSYEILREDSGYAMPGLYIIDPNGVLQCSVIHAESVPADSAEVLRVLQCLRER